jgi:chromosome segregation ATPase
MSEETTKQTDGKEPFEERVLSYLTAVNDRLLALEEKVERRMQDTRPIWERALAEIMETNKGIAEINKRLAALERKTDIVGKDLLNLRTDMAGIDERLSKIEGDSQVLTIG